MSVVTVLEGLVKGGDSLDAARSKLIQLVPDVAAVEAAVAELKLRANKFRIMKEPGGVVEPSDEPWYLGPTESDIYWPAYKHYLQAKKWESDAIDALDTSTTKIVSLLSHPGTGKFSTRGLVVGYVQSGKTANYTGVICKAADAGYKLFIVLAGMTDALRNQTQGRLNKEVVQLNIDRWATLTSAEEDFRQTTNVNAFLAQHSGLKVLCVVKKNGPILRRLRDWLRGARPEIITSCPTLIIDDEADQATPNTATAQQVRKAINARIIEVLGSLPRAGYVGYTATPFANLLIDPADAQDLYPRHFIVDLPRPRLYFGPERIFGREQLDWDHPDASADGLNMIRIIPVDEPKLLQPPSAATRFEFTPDVSPTLAAALDYFLMASAARVARGQSSEHSTMLIHTTQFAAVHTSFKPVVSAYLQEFAKRLKTKSGQESLAALWNSEVAQVPSELFDRETTSFETLHPQLSHVLDKVKVKVENAISTDRINYEDEPGQIQIVIGGNVLGRGLTLEGLLVSYFLRTASAYDTLLQMGRWFGYRSGYEDLPRVWMPAELRDYFYDLATVEAEIRHDIERYQSQHITPIDFGVRIRQHPQLAITSKLKMQNAVPASMSFSGTTVQTILFKGDDAKWLQRNLDAARSLLSSNRDKPVKVVRHNHVIEGITAERICDFLSAYRVHEDQQEFITNLVIDYIKAQQFLGHLNEWNVAVIGRKEADLGFVDLGLSKKVPFVNRSRFMRGKPEVTDIKSLISEMDVVADLVSVENGGGARRSVLLDHRQQVWPNTGLLLLYPIHKDSEPQGKPPHKLRRTLMAKEHVLGASIVFPRSPNPTKHNYVTVALGSIPEPDPDIPMETNEE